MNSKPWIPAEKAFALGLGLAGGLFLAAGVHRFWVRPEHLGLVSLLGCAVATFGAFFLLLVTDYLLHHARLVFLPWTIVLIYFAIIQPHLGVGLGLALGYIVVEQGRS